MPRRRNITEPDEQLRIILDKEAPNPLRLGIAAKLISARDPASLRQAILLIDFAAAGNEGEMDEKLKEFDALLETMRSGPLRLARCIETERAIEGPVDRVRVRSQDGTEFVAAVPDNGVAGRLSPGCLLAIDASGGAVLHVLEELEAVGEIGRLERRVNGRMAEVSVHGDSHQSLFLAARLREKLEAEEAGPGSRVIIDRKFGFAMDLAEQADEDRHYEFLDRSPPPDIELARDVGSPPAVIAEVAEHVRGELFNPAIRRAYGLPRSVSYLLVGPSGTGKTYSLQAIIRLVYEIMAEFTGVPMEALPPRVFRLRMSEVLSKFLGETDKRLSRLFSEAHQLYDEGWTAPDGRRYALPSVIVGEEIESLGRRRGGLDADGIHDRILATALQKFDPAGDPAYRDRLCLIFLTSNLPDIMDAAFYRRAGSVHRFGRLTDRGAFKAVLAKHVGRVPLAGDHAGSKQSTARRRAVEQVASHFFSRNGNGKALVELQFVGGASPVTRTFKDFLTPAMVAQAVHRAAARACRDEMENNGKGVNVEDVIAGLQAEVASVVDRLTELNAGDHVDLPEGNRVSRVRRLNEDT